MLDANADTADPMVPRIGRVRRRRREVAGVWTLDIELEETHGAGSAPNQLSDTASAPGQFNMLTVFGVG